MVAEWNSYILKVCNIKDGQYKSDEVKSIYFHHIPSKEGEIKEM
jgi:hypothetical protein